MNEVLEFLRKAGVFYLATSDGGQPRVRPMGFIMERDGKLVFSTSNVKPMYRQMKADPRVEFCGYIPDGSYVTLRGRAVFITTPEVQAAALEAAPTLKKMYSVGDGKFELFTLECATAAIFDAKGGRKDIAL